MRPSQAGTCTSQEIYMATETIDRAALAAEAAKRMQELAGGTANIPSLDTDPLLVKYQDALAALRKDGVNKILTLHQTISAAKKNKMLDAAERSKIIADCSSQIGKAKEIAAQNASAANEMTKDALVYANALAKQYIAQVDAEQDKRIVQLKDDYGKQVAQIQAYAQKRIAAASGDAQETARYDLKSALFDSKSRLE